MSLLTDELSRKISLRIERSKHQIPVGVSSRHVHFCQADWDKLFGAGVQPTKFRDLKQPGFWAAKETVAVEGPKGRIEKVRVIAPHRDHTQVELSKTDTAALGLTAPVRDSGQTKGSASARVIGPKGSIELKEGVLLARRHIHFSPKEAQAFGVKDGEVVRVRAGIGGQRELVFEQVLCRVSDKFSLEFHIDTDEANAGLVSSGDLVHIA